MVHRAIFLSVVALAAFGCGLSDEEVQIRCDQEKTNDMCVTDDAYQQCMSCYEECGDSCNKAESCPAQFICPQ